MLLPHLIMFSLISNLYEDVSDSVDHGNVPLLLDFPCPWQRRRHFVDDVDDATFRFSRSVHNRDWLAGWDDHKLGFHEIMDFNTHV